MVEGGSDTLPFYWAAHAHAMEMESEWRVVKVRSEPSEGSKSKILSVRIQGTERSRDLKDLVGAPIVKADVAKWAPATTPEALRLKDKIGEGFYLRTPISLDPLPPKAHQNQYDLCDAGQWPTMGAEGALLNPQLASWSKVVKAPAPIVTSHTKKKVRPMPLFVISYRNSIKYTGLSNSGRYLGRGERSRHNEKK